MTKIIYDAVNTSSFDQNSQRDIFAITVGNIGANIMGTGIGLVSSGFATGLGPFGMTYFGILGVTYGRLLGREMGLLIGKGLFDLFYIPYIYEPSRIIEQLRNEIEYNKSFTPNNLSFPY